MSLAGSEYESFLLRIWRQRRAGTLQIQVVLVSARTGEEWRFSDLASLASFLTRQREDGPAQPACDGPDSPTG